MSLAFKKQKENDHYIFRNRYFFRDKDHKKQLSIDR